MAWVASWLALPMLNKQARINEVELGAAGEPAIEATMMGKPAENDEARFEH